MAQQATIGRIVHYTLTESDLMDRDGNVESDGQVRAAIVTHVYEDGSLDIQLFMRITDECDIALERIQMVDEPMPGACHWPPRA